jgi:hypothetical protein
LSPAADQLLNISAQEASPATNPDRGEVAGANKAIDGSRRQAEQVGDLGAGEEPQVVGKSHEDYCCAVVGVSSQYRDEAEKQLRERAQTLESLFTDLAALGRGPFEHALAQLDLDNPEGPNPFSSPPASELAIKLAWDCVENALHPLADAISELGPQSPVLSALSLVPPGTAETHEAVLARSAERPYGLPLLDACLPNTVPPEQNILFLASRWLVARQAGGFNQANIPARLTNLLVFETVLWGLVVAYGGEIDRLPYFFRRRALRLFWTPGVHTPGAVAFALCIRCGTLIPPATTGRPRASLQPRCAGCAKEPPPARTWPAHAIAPHAGGTWFLHCQIEGCDQWFLGRRNRLRCDDHDSSRVTTSKRQPIGS